MPTAYASPARRRGRGRVLLVIGLIVLVLLLALGGGAFVANASLSSTYSPLRTVTDYFAAQASGNVKDMMSNATYLRGDGSYAQFFGIDAVTAMMAVAENRAIKDVKVTGVREVDSSTSTVTVSMTWAGAPHVHDYTVRKDVSRVHDYLYYSWRVDIPYTTINVTLPNQPGQLEVDHLVLPTGAAESSIELIQGYHNVSMLSTSLYDLTTQSVNGVSSSASIAFGSTLSASAATSAAASVKAAFAICNPADDKAQNCLGHTYHAPNDGSQYLFVNLPGYGQVNYRYFVWALTGDPTSSMTLVVSADVGKLTGNGTCTETLTVDGSRHLNFKGTWTGTVTFSAGTFSSSVIYDCTASKA